MTYKLLEETALRLSGIVLVSSMLLVDCSVKTTW